jgi:hypothetical protein
MPPPPSQDNNCPTSPPKDPDPPIQPLDKPNDIVLISLPPLPEPPPPTPQDTPAAPSGIASVPRSPSTAQTPSLPPRRQSGKERRAPDRYRSWAKSSKAVKDLDTPKTWQQLLKSPNKTRWLKAANNEFASLLGMNTRKLVPRPKKRKVIKSKWVFKIKRRPDRLIQKLKGCLVAMGYTQV